MKKILIMLLMILGGCETIQTLSSTQTGSDVPPKTIPNAKCENINAFKVFQVLDNFVLANVCRESDSEYCHGHTVYIPKEKGTIYFDDQRIFVKSGECPIYIGTYQYQTKVGYKTVPTAVPWILKIPF